MLFLSKKVNIDFFIMQKRSCFSIKMAEIRIITLYRILYNVITVYLMSLAKQN